MAGRSGGRGRGGRDGCGNNTNNRGGRGRVIYRARTGKTGLTKELKNNIFDLGERSSADLMRTTQIKIAQYIGTLYGGDIMGELETKTEFVPPSPTNPSSAVANKTRYETMLQAKQTNELDALTKKLKRVTTQIEAAEKASPKDTTLIETLED